MRSTQKTGTVNGLNTNPGWYDFVMSNVGSTEVYVSLPYYDGWVYKTYPNTANGGKWCGGDVIQTLPNYCLKVQDTNIQCVRRWETAG